MFIYVCRWEPGNGHNFNRINPPLAALKRFLTSRSESSLNGSCGDLKYFVSTKCSRSAL